MLGKDWNYMSALIKAIAHLRQDLSIGTPANQFHLGGCANRAAYFGAHPSAGIIAQSVAHKLLRLSIIFSLFKM